MDRDTERNERLRAKFEEEIEEFRRMSSDEMLESLEEMAWFFQQIRDGLRKREYKSLLVRLFSQSPAMDCEVHNDQR